MNVGTKENDIEARAYMTTEKRYKGKNPNLKCQHCHYNGHFTANLVDLINKFVTFIHKETRREEFDQDVVHEDGNTTVLLGKFAGFLANVDHMPKQDLQGLYHQEDDW
ncbi:hypothetical protein PS1_013616 [Malus domestica]